MKIDHILVPMDFSPDSESALAYATEIAALNNARLTLLHVVVMFKYDVDEEKRMSDYEEMVNHHSDNSGELLRGSVAAIEQKGLEVDTVILRGFSIPDTILNFVEKNAFDLVVLGTQGKTGLRHMLQGSVAEKIVRLVPVSTLTVHCDHPPFALNSVLCPIDFSLDSKTMLQRVGAFVADQDTHLHLVHVVESVLHPAYYAGGANSVFDIDKGLKDRITGNLETFYEETGLSNPVSIGVLEGSASNELVQYARKNALNLIAISTKGLSGLDHILVGSTAERIVRYATTPVLTLK
jgi:nucleotide-binding universal stress UspA family protein